MQKKKKIAVGITAGILGAGLIAGAVALTVNLTRPYESKDRTIYFSAPELTGDDAVTVPASGSAKRNVTAIVYDKKEGAELLDNPVEYTLDKQIKGVELDGNMLSVSAEVEENVSLVLTARDGAEGVKKPVYRELKIDIKKDPSLADIPANPLEKDGWKLYYHDEFDGNELDMRSWSPYYLRHWSDNDARTKANYHFEDGSLVLRCPEGLERWSSQDGNKVIALMSYEKNFLHKFGDFGSGATFNRTIPTFDGVATKYGYFEMRLKMPNTRDGSHFAWWMVGTQDDMNSTATLSENGVALKGHYSNETGEFDIIETSIASLEGMKSWRPVIHPNGTTDYEYFWVPETVIPGDPSNEYHIYGFEWDENGTKFYLDNKLVQESDRTPNYRMMTFISAYATGGLGNDRGIYPKDTYIDYFRIYKKDEAAKPNTVVLNNYQTPDFVYIPESGSIGIQMTAAVLDQFDMPIDAKVRWKLSETVDGFTPAKSKSAELRGVSINAKTGELHIDSSADEKQDIFVTAYVSDAVKQTYHIRLSREEALPDRIFFNAAPETVKAGGEADLSATLFDQYQVPFSGYTMRYQISEDRAGNDVKNISGVHIGSDGVLRVDSGVPAGTVIVVTAKSAGKYNSHAVMVES